VRRDLVYSPAFGRDLRSWLKARPGAAAQIDDTLNQLADDAFAPSLRTHKLRGPLSGHWACSAGYNLRIVFDLVQHEGAEAILLLGLGTHDEAY
jgi:mRNA-degrading endonuclease YafQ of YafQ-DinJ toxin-antitoxin module